MVHRRKKGSAQKWARLRRKQAGIAAVTLLTVIDSERAEASADDGGEAKEAALMSDLAAAGGWGQTDSLSEEIEKAQIFLQVSND